MFSSGQQKKWHFSSRTTKINKHHLPLFTFHIVCCVYSVCSMRYENEYCWNYFFGQWLSNKIPRISNEISSNSIEICSGLFLIIVCYTFLFFVFHFNVFGSYFLSSFTFIIISHYVTCYSCQPSVFLFIKLFFNSLSTFKLYFPLYIWTKQEEEKEKYNNSNIVICYIWKQLSKSYTNIKHF